VKWPWLRAPFIALGDEVKGWRRRPIGSGGSLISAISESEGGRGVNKVLS
jgi:hypothetical protein